MVARTIDFSVAAFCIPVEDQSIPVSRHLEDWTEPEKGADAAENMGKGSTVARDHSHFCLEDSEIRGVKGDEILVAKSFFEISIGSR